MDTLSLGSTLFLIIAIGMALGFEFVNGFHDTANAVATVIYTRSLRPWVAVIWSGCWNLIGVLTSTGMVAFGILALLPVELVLNVGSGAGFAMVFALLISAILWNLGTWYLGLPASSSHTLIGSIVGVGLANSLISQGHTFGDGVNWSKVQSTCEALLISPLVGFTCSALLLLMMKGLIRRKELYSEPAKDVAPPWWIRGVLVLTCTGVSFAHGSNDGQKGMGLLLLIVIGILPASYAVNLHASSASLQQVVMAAHGVQVIVEEHAAGLTVAETTARDLLNGYLKSSGHSSTQTFAAVASLNHRLAGQIAATTSLNQIPPAARSQLRSDVYLVGAALDKLMKKGALSDAAEKKTIASYTKSRLAPVTQFIPLWIKIAVAVSLGLGTMIGWKRIVTTIGEKIGKSHLTYGQGASAELVAMATIEAADIYGLPVSTTHVLSSGIAGTMVANRSGLQAATLRNIVLAWVLTLPVCVILGSLTFSAALFVVFHIFGLK